MDVGYKSSMKTQNLIKIMVVPFVSILAIGCTGNVFSSKGTSPSAGKNNGTVTGSPLASESLKISKISSEDMIRNLINENFSPTFATYITGPKQYYTLDVEIPYTRVLKPLSDLVRKYAPQVCKIANFAYAGDGVYHNEELPCGHPNSDGIWKHIFDVNIQGLNGWSGDVYYDLYGFNVSLMIGRTNQQGLYTEDSLDNKGNQVFTSSKTLGEDVSFRFRPHGNYADFDVCMNIPGLTITTPPIYIPGNAYKKILGVSITLDANMELKPGIVSYQYIRQCFSVAAGFNENSGMPIYQLTQVTNPDVVGAALNYTQMHFQSWFTNLVSGLLNLIGTNINQEIANYLQTAVKSASEDDVRNGQFLLDAARSTLGEEWTGKVSDAMAGRVNNELLPGNGVNFKEALRSQCDRISSLLSEYDENRLDPDKCRAFLDMVDIYMVPFKYSEELDQKGCYSHYANIHKANTGSENDYWWKTECKFNVKIMVGVPVDDDQQIRTAVVNLIATLRDEVHLGAAFTAASVSTSGLQLDSSTLDKILKQMKAEGYKNIAREQLTEFIRKNADLVRQFAQEI